MKNTGLLKVLLGAIAQDLEFFAMQVLNETQDSELAYKLQIDSEAVKQIKDWIS